MAKYATSGGGYETEEDVDLDIAHERGQCHGTACELGAGAGHYRDRGWRECR